MPKTGQYTKEVDMRACRRREIPFFNKKVTWPWFVYTAVVSPTEIAIWLLVVWCGVVFFKRQLSKCEFWTLKNWFWLRVIFWKPINRSRALGGGWGGGGPNPLLPSNVVPHTTIYITQNQNLPHEIAAQYTTPSQKISWKKCNPEVRHAFCNNKKFYWIKSLKYHPKKNPLKK